MKTIIIADGLTNDVCSPEDQFQEMRLHAGVDEINRLLGVGKNFGEGVLAKFLHVAAAAEKNGTAPTIFFVRDFRDPSTIEEEEKIRYGEHSVIGSKGVEFIDPLKSLETRAVILNTNTLAIPLQDFRKELMKATGIDPLDATNGELNQIRFLLVGFHTDKRILNTAYLLRNVFGFKQVAVCQHLVGSANRDAHFTTLRYHFPEALVKVFSALTDAVNFTGLPDDTLADFQLQACQIEPAEIKEKLADKEKMIVESLCMHWTKSELKELKGGFSGSFLFLANGSRGAARTEPMVIKIDSHLPIRKELKGYERVKDLLGKHVPTFSAPVSFGDRIGIGMELATMDGKPATLQDLFETADDDAQISHFLRILDRTLSLLVNKVYGNTLYKQNFVPYRRFLLHADVQSKYLSGNLESIQQQPIGDTGIVTEFVESTFQQVRKHDDGVFSEICLSHGDLNLANIICDDRENIWVIDWTHAGDHPLELDFTKLENDLKFVISKLFHGEDYAKLKSFENYLLNQISLPALQDLPTELSFVRWDLRFKKVFLAVQKIRQAYLSIKKTSNGLIYRMALLKYAVHTLSFDKRRNRGECEPIQLWTALASVDMLLEQLVFDEYHLSIRGEKPDGYPERYRIFWDKAKWEISLSDDEYAPPYYVEEAVLLNDRSKVSDGWADPEDVWDDATAVAQAEGCFIDSQKRPCNPTGRTGIAGRGALGRWGKNPILFLLVTRINPETNDPEILLAEGKSSQIRLLENFLGFAQPPEALLQQFIREVTNLQPNPKSVPVIHQGYLYDPRQTDHAWLDAVCYLFHLSEADALKMEISPQYSQLIWKTMTPELINQVSSNQAKLLREAVGFLQEKAIVETSLADEILNKT